MVLFELGPVCFVEILQQNKVICGREGFPFLAPQPLNVFFHTARQTDKSRLISQVMKNGASDVRSCIGAEWSVVAGSKALNSLDQAQPADLNQIIKILPTPIGVVKGNGLNQAKVLFRRADPR